MCMMLYVSSDNSLPVVESIGESAQLLSVRELNCNFADDKFTSEHLTKKYKYGIVSWQACGCGFQFDYNSVEFEDEYNESGKQSLNALFEYLRNNVQGDECDLISIWAGKYNIEYNTVMDL